MSKWLKISQHKHSCKLQPHKHTSYTTLWVLLLVVGIALYGFTTSVSADHTTDTDGDGHPGPFSESIGISGEMPAEPPTEAAVITSPTTGQTFTTSPITVSGTCPKDTLVELYKSDIFAGSTPCASDKTFSLDIDLLFGTNNLVARVYDSLNQQGPDSNIVTVYYNFLGAQSAPMFSSDFAGNQLLIITDAVFRGVFPNKELNVPIQIIGGAAPYAVNIQWGDSKNSVYSRNDNFTFSATHIYAKAGTYQLTIQATDSTGRIAFLTVAVIVNGQPSITATETTTSTSTTNKLLLLWPLYLCLVAVVIAFFLGEKREKHVLRQKGLLITQYK